MIAVVGTDPAIAAEAALGLAHARARRQRVTIIDLSSGTESLAPVLASDDPHGVSDCFAYGISFTAATHATHEANIFVIPRGTEPITDAAMLASPRWDRFVEGARAAGELLIWIVPPDLPGAEAVIARVDRVVPADTAARSALPADWAAKRARPARWQADAPSRTRRIVVAAIAAALIGAVAWIAVHTWRGTAAADSDLTPLPPPTPASGDTGRPAQAPAPAAAVPAPVPAAPAGGFLVQFTATRSRDTARAVAARVHVPGAEPHIVSDTRHGKPLYLVVVGPYPTSAKADSVGRTAHAQYYVRQNPLRNP